jgi:hypothetical protein
MAVHGKSTKIYANGIDLTAFFSSVSVAPGSPALDASVFGKGYQEFLAGLVFGGTFKLDGLFSGGAGEAEEVFRVLFLAGTDATYSYLLNGEAAGQPGFVLPCKHTNHAISSSITELVRISLDNQINGNPMYGISLGASAQRTAASQVTTGYDMGAGYSGTLAGALIQVAVAAAGGDSSVVVTIETADDSGFSTNLGTIASATCTAIGAYLVPEAAMTVRRYVRLKAACAAGETITVHGLLAAR